MGQVSQEDRHYRSEGTGEKAAGVLEVGGSGGKGWASAERRGCGAGRGSSVIRAEIDGKGRHRRQRESIKREAHIRGDRESFKLQGCCHHGGWKEGALEPREGGEF